MIGLGMFFMVVVIPGTVLVVLYGWYASIITRKNRMKEALAGVDVQLRRRHNIIPNVLVLAKKYMDHERDLMDHITRLRTRALEMAGAGDSASTDERFRVERELQTGLGKLQVQMENYPQLKSDRTMTEAMGAYQETEADIAAARRFYNSSVASLENAVQIFPGTFIADVMDIEVMPFFQADDVSRAPVPADSVFK